jgi:hypothetical protein
MTSYAQELRRCQVVLLLRAVIAGHGSMSAGAKLAGVHRNTVRRVLYAAGYDARQLRRIAKVHNEAAQRKAASAQ